MNIPFIMEIVDWNLNFSPNPGLQLLFFLQTSNYCIFLAWNSARYTLVLRHLILMSGTRAVGGCVLWAWRWSWLGAFVQSMARNPLTREQGGEQRRRVLSLLMWPMMWFISHCSHVNYIPKIQTLFLKEMEQNLHLILDNHLHSSLPHFFSFFLFWWKKSLTSIFLLW